MEDWRRRLMHGVRVMEREERRPPRTWPVMIAPAYGIVTLATRIGKMTLHPAWCEHCGK